MSVLGQKTNLYEIIIKINISTWIYLIVLSENLTKSTITKTNFKNYNELHFWNDCCSLMLFEMYSSVVADEEVRLWDRELFHMVWSLLSC